jgi:hypothetical protein
MQRAQTRIGLPFLFRRAFVWLLAVEIANASAVSAFAARTTIVFRIGFA